jgi:Cupredoxin-like domain
MDNDNIPAYIKILFVMNSIALIGVLILAFYVTNRDYIRPAASDGKVAIDTSKNIDLENGEQDQKPASEQKAEDGDAAQTDISKIFAVEIGDEGFVNKGFQAVGGEKIVFSVKNSGSKPHSLVIDELSVDSGEIEAGGAKEITVDQLPDESKSYTFYSQTEGDSKDDFSGILMVLKK